ncbi:hypothetical protein DFP72DRAFT_1110854 [Ephemerocybe angulata]|uniref:Uncharacterized protein n=1 Tax=Ephemerocybe angulata TaxID=980116 RepID=A0A8H6H9B4_9AGAR|nr:hypothetical protein DFP72DRAFT_1110854 [Tulosesus angulatus]
MFTLTQRQLRPTYNIALQTTIERCTIRQQTTRRRHADESFPRHTRFGIARQYFPRPPAPYPLLELRGNTYTYSLTKSGAPSAGTWANTRPTEELRLGANWNQLEMKLAEVGLVHNLKPEAGNMGVCGRGVLSLAFQFFCFRIDYLENKSDIAIAGTELFDLGDPYHPAKLNRISGPCSGLVECWSVEWHLLFIDIAGGRRGTRRVALEPLVPLYAFIPDYPMGFHAHGSPFWSRAKVALCVGASSNLSNH